MVQPIDRAAFLAAMAPSIQAVVLQDGSTAYVREVSVGDTERASTAASEEAESTRLARAAAVYLCDAEGRQLFNPYSADDIALISGLGWKKVRAILKAGDAFNSLGDAEKNGEVGDTTS